MTTIKDLADQLQVSKPTITNVISALGILPTRSGNKYILSGDQVEQITTQIAKRKNAKTQNENEKSQNDFQESQKEVQKLQSDFQKSQNQNEKLLIELLQQQLTTKDRQIAEYQEQIKVYQRQIDKLTDSLNDTTQALSAAQALHAGTIQKQLTAQINNEESAPEQEEQHPKKRGIFSKFFHSDDKK